MLETNPDLIFSIIWCHVCFAAGLLGNGWLLFATIRLKALKLDRISLWTLQNVGVLDIASCFALLLPVITVQYGVLQAEGPTQFYRAFSIYGRTNYSSPTSTGSNITSYGGLIRMQPAEWVPTPICKAVAVYEFSFLAGNGALMSVLSVNKLTRCLFPLRNMYPGRLQLATITIFTGTLIGIPAVWQSYLYTSGASKLNINTDIHICELWFVLTGDNAVRQWHFNGMYAILTICAVIPFSLIVIANVSLVTYAVRKRGIAVRKSGVFLCLAITICQTIAYLPTCVSFLPFHFDVVLLEKIRWNFAFLSSWINPVMCFLTNQPFRTSTLELLKCRAKGRGKGVENIGEGQG